MQLLFQAYKCANRQIYPSTGSPRDGNYIRQQAHNTANSQAKKNSAGIHKSLPQRKDKSKKLQTGTASQDLLTGLHLTRVAAITTHHGRHEALQNKVKARVRETINGHRDKSLSYLPTTDQIVLTSKPKAADILGAINRALKTTTARQDSMGVTTTQLRQNLTTNENTVFTGLIFAQKSFSSHAILH